MSYKTKKLKIPILTEEDIHNSLFACINCKYENTCTEQLPFPMNLCEKCDKYVKINFKERNI